MPQPFEAQIVKRISIWSMLLMSLKATVHTLNVPNGSSCIHLFAPAAWCFIRTAFLASSFLRRFFRLSAPRRSLNFLWLSFFTVVQLLLLHHGNISSSGRASKRGLQFGGVLLYSIKRKKHTTESYRVDVIDVGMTNLDEGWCRWTWCCYPCLLYRFRWCLERLIRRPLRQDAELAFYLTDQRYRNDFLKI